MRQQPDLAYDQSTLLGLDAARKLITSGIMEFLIKEENKTEIKTTKWKNLKTVLLFNSLCLEKIDNFGPNRLSNLGGKWEK